MKEKSKTGFERRKEQSKENIRKAAAELFSQFGVEKVSVSDIARKADVSIATIYNNFGSKEALVREFVSLAVDELVDSAQAVLSPPTPFDEKITNFVQFISGVMAQGAPPQIDRNVMASSVDLQLDPEIKRIRETAKKKMIGLLIDAVQEGKDQGVIKSDYSEEALTIYFNVFMELFIDPKLQIKLFANPNLVEDLTALIFGGLR